jgi:hypothetical protein
MKRTLAAVTLLAAIGGVQAESTYGYSTTGATNATARVNLSVTVPRIILLRVGTAGTTLDTASWAIGATIPLTPSGTTAAATTPAGGTAAAWNDTAPTFAATPTGNTVTVAAYTNTGSSTLGCSATAVAPATGPALTAFTVSTTGTLTHPGTGATPALSTCASTPTTIASGAVRTASWTYNLDATGAATWAPGSYASVVTYTATAP